ncbi:MAG TPA: enoyl-CoA hydratase/isomerase family protein [Thermoanaerobaculia bacterium]|nr:enoyl-CoA hydratase/isomerase family protein [Thermoanaerobaculia bacterium]
MIERSDNDGIAILRLAHGKASAMDLELSEAILSAIDGALDARAIVLTGTGSIFSAGVDLFRLVDEGEPYARRFSPALIELLTGLFTIPIPVVAACNGHAIAGGCIMVAACDYRLMAAGDGRVGVPELLVGVAFPPIALEIARYGMAPQFVQEMVYTGRTVGPDEALRRGMIDEVVDPAQLLPRALAVAAQLAAVPKDVFRITKMQLRRETIERARALGEMVPVVEDIWAAPESHARIREYLAKTIRKSR